jgi:hypothetical protein
MMAQNRKRKCTSAETLAFIIGDIDIPDLEEQSSNTNTNKEVLPNTEPDLNEHVDVSNTNNELLNTPILAEIEADIARLDEEFDRRELQNIANTINRSVDFEIEQTEGDNYAQPFSTSQNIEQTCRTILLV